MGLAGVVSAAPDLCLGPDFVRMAWTSKFLHALVFRPVKEDGGWSVCLVI